MVKRIYCTEEDVELIVSILEFWEAYNVERDGPVTLGNDGYITFVTISMGSVPIQEILSEGFSFSISASIVKSGYIKFTFSRWE